MEALNNMRKRLQYNGGEFQQSRMIEGKLQSLKKALLYSYQAGTMVIDNPKYDEKAKEGIESLPVLEFRCLMNPDKLTFNEDKKMLSVPFKDICLNAERVGKMSEGTIDIPVECGTTFMWKETNSRWLVTLRYLEELAYFRADVRKCFPYSLDINGKSYWFSSVGEDQETIEWNKKKHEEWNQLNYTRLLYIKRDENTLDYFKRFKVIKVPNIDGKLESWEVQTVAPNSIDNVIKVYIKEYFENPYEEISEIAQQQIAEMHELNEDLEMYVYGSLNVSTSFVENAYWEIKNATSGMKFELDAIKKDDNTIVTIESLSGKSGSFDLYYNDKLVNHVVVKSIKR